MNDHKNNRTEDDQTINDDGHSNDSDDDNNSDVGKLLEAAIGLVKAVDKVVDDKLPLEIANVVKYHSKGIAIAFTIYALISWWAFHDFIEWLYLIVVVLFQWSMYFRINNKIDTPLGNNIIKTVIFGIVINITMATILEFILSLALMPLAGLDSTFIGFVILTAIVGSFIYIFTLASGFIYLKIMSLPLFQKAQN